MIVNEAERFNTENPNLCPSLRWKRIYIQAEKDPTVQPCNDGSFWCVHTQTCIGPDGDLAEPGNCCSKDRKCHCG